MGQRRRSSKGSGDGEHDDNEAKEALKEADLH